MIEVALVEDHFLFRTQLALLINRQTDMQCRLQVSALGELFEALAQFPTPDVLLLDISLGTTNSLDHLAQISRLLPAAKIIMFTGHQNTSMLMRALKGGAHGYFLKSNDPDKLLEVIRLTLNGGAYLEPVLATPIVELLHQHPEQAPDMPDSEQAPDKPDAAGKWGLNQREVQIMNGLLEGKSYKEIGTELHIGLNTVRVYVKSLYRKVEVNSRQMLVNKIKADLSNGAFH